MMFRDPRNAVRRLVLAALLWLGAAAGFGRARAAAAPAEGGEFFEKKIRPLLADRCFKCHSAQSEKLKAGLHLDSREGMLKGGDTGPALTPGVPEKSLLVEAVHYENVDLQMPPKGKLSAEQIGDLETWIRNGAVWAGSSATPAAPSGPSKAVFNLAQRRQYWCWQPVRATQPPEVRQTEWPANEVDRFLLAKLEANHLAPNPAADRRTLIRRLSFDLTGLPPTTGEAERFAGDADPLAWEHLADRLLASPRFGERWARHWLDLARYSETMGHEFDYVIANVWQYRDYVIRAFNEDLPYNQFVMEQVAGDLLPPRIDRAHEINEAVVATTFLCLGQQSHSPVDARQAQADFVDNQIDVLTKTFLGLTVSCARCHDHKFDAISTKDYYSLYGIMESSRFAMRPVDSGRQEEGAALELASAKAGLRAAVAQLWLSRLAEAEARLGMVGKVPPAVEKTMGTNGTAPGSSVVVFADGPGGGFGSWRGDGAAMLGNPVRPGDFVPGGATNPVAEFPEAGTLQSALLSRRLEGAIRSPTFLIPKNYVHVLGKGRGSRLNVVIDNFTLIRDPIYGGLKRLLDTDQTGWITVDTARWKGQRAYLELEDISQPDPADATQHANGYPKDSYFAVQKVVFSDDAKPPVVADTADANSTEELAVAAGSADLRQRLEKVIAGWGRGSLREIEADPAAWRLARRLAQENLVESVPSAESTSELRASFETVCAALKKAEEGIGRPRYAAVITEGNGMDETVFIRGSPRNPGAVVPRRFLEAVGGPDQACFSEGSGRLELARRLADPANPLTARVMVNRVWSHLFGRGIVASTDNFGVLGEAPSHPELLDWLANWYMENGWSTKKLIRLLVTSRAYRMSSRAGGGALEAADPGDHWLHRMRVRRLEGEAIRDAILSVAGELDDKMYGPPVPVHLTEFMEGRGRPGKSGPLDGDRRRSVYLEVRRNFLNPFMMAFDTPSPFTTVGHRTDSNLPAQALILMNDPFVAGEAEAWARRLIAEPGTAAEGRIREMYLAAFGRAPGDFEEKAALDFLALQGAELGAAPETRISNEHLWAGLAHVLLNVSEFVDIE